MRTSPWPTIASFATSAIVMIAIALLADDVLILAAVLAAAIFTIITLDMSVRAWRSRHES